ncbi:MAG: hypothetical protein U5N27_00195 [Rhizobium sp.]|nr:hypothetical protein [Rhizobium sp.]
MVRPSSTPSQTVDGRDVREVYKVNADKSVTLVNRTVSNAS